MRVKVVLGKETRVMMLMASDRFFRSSYIISVTCPLT